MTLTVDKAGRVILPKPVRDKLGLRPGSELDMQMEADGELRLRPKTAGPTMLNVKGILVHQGKALAKIDWDRVVEVEREERARAVSEGLGE